ncbi:MAG TPA: hypothetical protein VLC52_00885 [Anaerolineae bacterium]|nr:hypothetical protein [Anaerolineae bacterium]
MSNRHGWMIFVTLVALLLAACGPEMSTPTAGVPAPTATSAEAAETAPATSQAEVVPPEDLPVDPDNWRALGAPDAPVTIIEYSDFQ